MVIDEAFRADERDPVAWRRRRSSVLWALSAVSLLVLAVVLWAMSGQTLTPTAAAAESAVDLGGNAVLLEDPIEDAALLEQMDVNEDDGDRFEVPSVGLDVALGSLNAIEGQITPPGFTSAYIVRNLGTPGAPELGTTYVVMHSIPNPGLAPGNYLIDVDTGTASVAPGTRVEMNELTYVVDSAHTIGKGELASRQEVWRDVPGRLVIITCQQLPSGGRSAQNTVIEAHLEQS